MRIYREGTPEEILVPAYSVKQLDDKSFVFTIEEGPYQGINFQLDNMHMHETDESLLEYDLKLEDKDHDILDFIKPIVDNIILGILYEQIDRAKEQQNENPPTE